MKATARKINGEWIAEVSDYTFEYPIIGDTANFKEGQEVDGAIHDFYDRDERTVFELTKHKEDREKRWAKYNTKTPPPVHSDPSGTNKKIPTWAWNLLRGYMKDSYAIKCWDKLTNYYQTEFGTPSNLPSGEGKGKYYHETEYLDHAEDAFQSGREAGLKEAALQNYDYLYRALYNLWSDVIYNKNVEGKDNALKKATDALMKYEGYHPSLPKPEGKEDEMAISFGHWLDRNSGKYRRYTDPSNQFKDYSTEDVYYNIRDLYPIFLEEFPQFKSLPNPDLAGYKELISPLIKDRGEGKEPWLEDLINTRNSLYNELPTGELRNDLGTVWALLDTIKWHINALDNLMERHSKSLPLQAGRMFSEGEMIGFASWMEKHEKSFAYYLDGIEYWTGDVTMKQLLDEYLKQNQ